MEQTDSCRKGGRKRKWWKEGIGISQRTCMNDPWTWKMERGLTMGKSDKLGVREEKGKKLGQL